MGSSFEDTYKMPLPNSSPFPLTVPAVALPFVADDLFINFDPARSVAGFEVLGQLAERTQVLFYTHHPHLVDVVRETLGIGIDVISLDEVA